MFININTLVPFLEEPNRKFHLREYSRVLRISPATAAKYLRVLANEELVTRKKGKVYDVFEANSNASFSLYKVFLTVDRLVKSGLLEFLDKELAFPTVVLFGSCAKGEDVAGSDLDLFVLSNTKKELDLSAYGKKIRKAIQLFVMNDAEFKEAVAKSPELVNNVLNGIKLAGFLKVF